MTNNKILNQIINGNRVMSVKTVLSRLLSRNSNLRRHEILIRLVVTYTAEPKRGL